jgi:hypothetical protein
MKMTVRDYPNLVRDSQSKAIISEDVNGYQSYIKERNIRATMSTVTEDVDSLKKDIMEIKNLLEILVDNSKHK